MDASSTWIDNANISRLLMAIEYAEAGTKRCSPALLRFLVIVLVICCEIPEFLGSSEGLIRKALNILIQSILIEKRVTAILVFERNLLHCPY